MDLVCFLSRGFVYVLACFARVNGADWLLRASGYSICMIALAPAIARAAERHRAAQIPATGVLSV